MASPNISKSTRVLIRAKGRGLCIERGLNDCLKKELFTDVSLNYAGGKVRANKGVLAAASPVFSCLLKDWLLAEDPCIVMAGYTAEEVQGLVKYIYTGQLAAPAAKESKWQKIFDDFQIGMLPEEEDEEEDDNMDDSHFSDTHLLANETMENIGSPEPSPQSIASKSQWLSPKPPRPVKHAGPRIVAVTPRPTVVKFHSPPTQRKEAPQIETRVPNVEAAVDEGTVETNLQKRHRDSDWQVNARKSRRIRGPSDQTPPPTSTTLPPAHKKYVCPYCQRRFLTKGNIKNHIKIHTKERPYRCDLCNGVFSYLGVYERHLMKHREYNDITQEVFEEMVKEAFQTQADRSSEESFFHIDNAQPGASTEEAADRPDESNQTKEAMDGVQEPEEAVSNEMEEEPLEEQVNGDESTDHLIADGAANVTNKLKRIDLKNKANKVSEESSNQKESHADQGPHEEVGEPNAVLTGDSNAAAVDNPTEEMDFKCGVCEKAFQNNRALKTHYRIHTQRTLSFPCKLCPQVFRSYKERLFHERRHGPRRSRGGAGDAVEASECTETAPDVENPEVPEAMEAAAAIETTESTEAVEPSETTETADLSGGTADTTETAETNETTETTQTAETTETAETTLSAETTVTAGSTDETVETAKTI